MIAGCPRTKSPMTGVQRGPSRQSGAVSHSSGCETSHGVPQRDRLAGTRSQQRCVRKTRSRHPGFLRDVIVAPQFRYQLGVAVQLTERHSRIIWDSGGAADHVQGLYESAIVESLTAAS